MLQLLFLEESLHLHFISIDEFILFYTRNCKRICLKEKNILLLLLTTFLWVWEIIFKCVIASFTMLLYNAFLIHLKRVFGLYQNHNEILVCFYLLGTNLLIGFVYSCVLY